MSFIIRQAFFFPPVSSSSKRTYDNVSSFSSLRSPKMDSGMHSILVTADGNQSKVQLGWEAGYEGNLLATEPLLQSKVRLPL